jgi:hypothetical protein
MPQIVAAVLIGVGVAAGVKWIAREVAKAAQAARLAPEDLQRHEPVTAAPRDLGALVYDAKTGVYRPAGKRAH